LLLHGQGQQMGQMLAARCAHFRAQQPAAGRVRIDMKQARVALRSACTPLVREIHAAHHEVLPQQRLHGLAHDGRVGRAEDDGQRRAPRSRPRSLPWRWCRDMAFVHGLMQQGAVAIGIAREEQRQLADLQCLAAHGRLAVFVQLKSQRLQAQAFELRAPTHGGHHVVHDDAGVACARRCCCPGPCSTALRGR
jgi:uncharacterized protein YjhX (UPF0386 family)